LGVTLSLKGQVAILDLRVSNAIENVRFNTVMFSTHLSTPHNGKTRHVSAANSPDNPFIQSPVIIAYEQIIKLIDFKILVKRC
jgi:hypothetical protein